MKVSFYSDKFFLSGCRFEDRQIPRAAGFRWDAISKQWYTQEHTIASRLISYCDDSAKKQIIAKHLKVDKWTGGLVIPDGETLLEFQKEACLFALERNRSYLGLDPGLGKTIVAAIIAASFRDKHHEKTGAAFVYICPPFLVRNTQSEFDRFAPKVRMTIIPDTMLQKYGRYQPAFAKNIPSILFVDEAHRFKNEQARRTKALFNIVMPQFDRVVFLSGTPMPNRPIELYPVLRHAAPETIDNMTKFQFGQKYCALHKTNFGWDFSGSSNMEELSRRVVGKFMLRMRKRDVLKDLPPKIEEMVILSDEMPATLANLNSRILKTFSPEDLMKGAIAVKLDKNEEELHLATYRKELGLAKIESSVEYIKYLLDSTEESILVFAHHKEVIKKLSTALVDFAPLVITGETPMETRHEMVKAFQNNSIHRILIGNIQAAGLGLTLTKATRVVFVEFDWVPGNNEQASDRAHRIGQDERVLVQYLVFKNSIDRAVIETVLRKKKITEYV